jgi:hypothetical protein
VVVNRILLGEESDLEGSIIRTWMKGEPINESEENL